MGGYGAFVGDGFDDVCVDVVEGLGGCAVPCVPCCIIAVGCVGVGVDVGREEMVETVGCALSVELDDGLVVVETF